MDLIDQTKLVESFDEWFSGGLQSVIDDNRKRYRMEMKDAAQRTSRGLSSLPSVKSMAVVDNCVNRALEEYHLDPNAISFTSRAPGNLDTESSCKWLSEIVKIRSDHPYFPFFTWNQKSLKAGFTDGMEAALVTWSYQTKTKKVREYQYRGQPIDKALYDQYSLIEPGFTFVDRKKEIPVQDTWWIDQLMPGKDISWDAKAPLFNLNLSSWVKVSLRKPISWIQDQIKLKIFDKISLETLKQNQDIGLQANSDTGTVATNPDYIDFGDLNSVEVWLFFDKEDNDWGVQFSLRGKTALSSRKPVNDVFFRGREVNCLPVAMGYTDPELHENVGRGIPKIIAPLEDEATDHRNNYNDWAKQVLRGKYWKQTDSDIDIDDLINTPVVRLFVASRG
jgi:hypothetical protein